MSTPRSISNTQDIIDSRDIIARLEWLKTLEGDELSTGEMKELLHLQDLAEEASHSPDWHYGETLIRDSYFREYAQELADDIGATTQDDRWPYTHIDWEAAARDLKQDYFDVDFGDVTYWIRG